MIEKKRLPVAPDRAGYILLPTRACRVELPRLFVHSSATATERQAGRQHGGARCNAHARDGKRAVPASGRAAAAVHSRPKCKGVAQGEESRFLRNQASGSEEARHTSERGGRGDIEITPTLPRNRTLVSQALGWVHTPCGRVIADAKSSPTRAKWQRQRQGSSTFAIRARGVRRTSGGQAREKRSMQREQGRVAEKTVNPSRRLFPLALLRAASCFLPLPSCPPLCGRLVCWASITHLRALPRLLSPGPGPATRPRKRQAKTTRRGFVPLAAISAERAYHATISARVPICMTSAARCVAENCIALQIICVTTTPERGTSLAEYPASVYRAVKHSSTQEWRRVRGPTQYHLSKPPEEEDCRRVYPEKHML